MKYRTKDYYKSVFNLVGKDAMTVAEFKEAAACVDETLGQDFVRSEAAMQVWASSKVRTMKELPATLVEVTKDGNSFKIKLHDADAVAEELGVRWEKKTYRKEEASEPAVKARETYTTLTQKDEFFITFKACRSAVRVGNGKMECVPIKKKDLVDACKYEDKITKVKTEYTVSQIMTAISKTSTAFSFRLEAELKDGVVEFRGQDKALERICAVGREVYPGMQCFLFEEAAGAAALKNIKEQKIQAASAERKQQQKPITTVLTDDERFRIFLCGGYIMEHDRVRLEDLQEYLVTKGMGVSSIKLESTIRLAKEFIIEGNIIYLDSREKDFWDKFRKQYRPIDTNDFEQVIFEMAVSEEYVKERLLGCDVKLASPDRPIYRVNIPRRSAVANKNFRKFLQKFREGDYMYTDTSYIRQLRKKAEKDEAQAVLEDDVCRYEIGYFFNEKKGD